MQYKYFVPLLVLLIAALGVYLLVPSGETERRQPPSLSGGVPQAEAPARLPPPVEFDQEWEEEVIEAVGALADDGRDLENYLVLMLSTGGPVIIETFPDLAPNHVTRFAQLARQSFYDGLTFHRVIDGFMAQTGDPTGTGGGGSGMTLAAEFNDINHVRGIVSTARSDDPDSADSQFFIMLGSAPHLDGNYTAWGRVIEGMKYVDDIVSGRRSAGGMVPAHRRDHIVSMQVAADVEPR